MSIKSQLAANPPIRQDKLLMKATGPCLTVLTAKNNNCPFPSALIALHFNTIIISHSRIFVYLCRWIDYAKSKDAGFPENKTSLKCAVLLCGE